MSKTIKIEDLLLVLWFTCRPDNNEAALCAIKKLLPVIYLSLILDIIPASAHNPCLLQENDMHFVIPSSLIHSQKTFKLNTIRLKHDGCFIDVHHRSEDKVSSHNSFEGLPVDSPCQEFTSKRTNYAEDDNTNVKN